MTTNFLTPRPAVPREVRTVSALGDSQAGDSGVATAVRTGFEPLESKLYPPPARVGAVVRTSLIGRLRASRTEPVVAIIAGPGFGKTTLLTQWADADERPFAWVSLDDRDNDPAVFLACVAEALHRIGAATAPLFDALASPGGASDTTLMARLGTAVLGMAPSVLVLDDVHLLRNRACVDAIATLIVHAPGGVPGGGRRSNRAGATAATTAGAGPGARRSGGRPGARFTRGRHLSTGRGRRSLRGGGRPSGCQHRGVGRRTPSRCDVDRGERRLRPWPSASPVTTGSWANICDRNSSHTCRGRPRRS